MGSLKAGAAAGLRAAAAVDEINEKVAAIKSDLSDMVETSYEDMEELRGELKDTLQECTKAVEQVCSRAFFLSPPNRFWCLTMLVGFCARWRRVRRRAARTSLSRSWLTSSSRSQAAAVVVAAAVRTQKPLLATDLS
eukprot:COSAG04_NODE_140_length_23600_cov_1779.264414_18_plen_137_part_00